MTRRALIRQAELTRIAKAMREAGVEEYRVELLPSGQINVIVVAGATALEDENPCDELLTGLKGRAR